MVLAKRLSFTLMTAFLALAMVFVGTMPAQAHDELLETNPAPDAQLDVAPQEIVFSFSNNLIELGNIVHIQDADGKEWAAGEPTIKRHQIIQQMLPDAPEGWYRINWRAVSSDGHPITGTQVFLIGNNSDLPVPAISGGNADESQDAADSDAADNQTDQSDDQNTALIIAISSGVVVVGVVIVLVFLRKRKQK